MANCENELALMRIMSSGLLETQPLCQKRRGHAGAHRLKVENGGIRVTLEWQ